MSDTTSLTKATQGSSYLLYSSVWVTEGRLWGLPGGCTKDTTRGGIPAQQERQIVLLTALVPWK
jgi:hypothetical protein